MSKHNCDRRQALPVAELLEREAERGTPLRLNWPAECLDPLGGVRDWDAEEWPTGELPALTDDVLAELDALAGPQAVPEARRPPWEPDGELLGRLLNGLKRLP